MPPRLLPLTALLCLFAADARAGVALLGRASIPGDAADRSGLAGKLADGTPRDRLGGCGSAIAYTGRGTEYVLATDRGPGDAGTDFPCRFHTFSITVSPGDPNPVRAELLRTTLLTDEKGRRFVGSEDALDPVDPARSLRLDPEGIRVGRGGTLFVSDEFGPWVCEFDPSGKRLRSLPVPVKFRPAKPGRSAKAELPPRNTSGRNPNRGFEGLAISPDGSKLFALLQGPLLQDGALDKENTPAGVNCRLLEIDAASGKTREFVYQLDHPAHGANEILAVNDREFLVIERDGKHGKDAACKKVFRIDISAATDVSRVAALPAAGLPAGVVPVAKSPFLDLLDPRFRIAGKDCPAKFEGLAFGPDLPDGRRLLLVTVDNDFVPEQPTLIFAFAADPADLPDYEPQRFEPKK